MTLTNHPINPLTERAIGAAIEVHRHLGPGLLESSYQVCFGHELELRGIDHKAKVPVPLVYKGQKHPQAYVADFILENRLIIEIKSLDALKPVHSNQLITYMRLLDVSAGLLVNFNVPRLTNGIVRRLL